MVPLRAFRSAPEHTHPDDVSLLTALAALADPVRLKIVCDLSGSPDWTRTCGSFEVPVRKAALSHHFAVLRAAGLVEQRDVGPRRLNRLRSEEFATRFPGLLELTLGQRHDQRGLGLPGSAERKLSGCELSRRELSEPDTDGRDAGGPDAGGRDVGGWDAGGRGLSGRDLVRQAHSEPPPALTSPDS